MDKEEGLLGSRAQPGWLGPSTGQACSSLSLCALSTLCHQGPEQVPGVLDSRSRTERVAPHTSLASSAKWMPSSAERAPGTPAAPNSDKTKVMSVQALHSSTVSNSERLERIQMPIRNSHSLTHPYSKQPQPYTPLSKTATPLHTPILNSHSLQHGTRVLSLH